MIDNYTVYGYEALAIRHYRLALRALAIEDAAEYGRHLAEAVNYVGRVMGLHEPIIGGHYDARYNEVMVELARAIAAPDIADKIIALREAGAYLDAILQFAPQVEEIYYYYLLQEFNEAYPPATVEGSSNFAALLMAPLNPAVSNKTAYLDRIKEVYHADH
jgi:hypothetical protein